MTTDQHLTTDQHAGRRATVRALERLRSGLPPDEGAQEISVGMNEFEPLLEAFLGLEGRTAKGIAVLGAYGAGKTHTLTLIRDSARSRGFATAVVNADSAESALNHPQRFMSGLLQNLHIGTENLSYPELLVQRMSSVDGVRELAHVAESKLPTGAYLDRSARWGLYALESKLSGSHADAADLLVSQDELLRLLCGETLVASPGTSNYRASAYRLLDFADAILRLSGCHGVVIVIDEVESIFTKLANRLSRRGAFRVLAALLGGIGSPSIRVALGLTTDGWEWLKVLVSIEKDRSSCTVHENLDELGTEIASLPVYQCEPLTRGQLADVLERVRSLHNSAYGEWALAETWSEHRERVLVLAPNPRLAIRDAIDFLDRSRFRDSATL
jgi:hypothetical protein